MTVLVSHCRFPTPTDQTLSEGIWDIRFVQDVHIGTEGVRAFVSW